MSKRDMAELEDRVCDSVATAVRDPVLHQPLSKLQWLSKRIAVSETDDSTLTTLQMLLRLPSLLHPSLDELKRLVQTEAESQVQMWLKEKKYFSEADLQVVVNVEAIVTTPVPMMMRLVEDRDDLLTSLGPGLASVAHFVAVYSCKVIRLLFIGSELLHELRSVSYIYVIFSYHSMQRVAWVDRGFLS